MSWRWLVLLCVLPALCEAIGPVLDQSCQARWKKAQKNEDGTPLKNLHHYELFISTQQGVYSWDEPTLWADANKTHVACPTAVLQRNGQYYAVVVAVDSAGRRSAPSNEFAFVVARPALREDEPRVPWHPKMGW